MSFLGIEPSSLQHTCTQPPLALQDDTGAAVTPVNRTVAHSPLKLHFFVGAKSKLPDPSATEQHAALLVPGGVIAHPATHADATALPAAVEAGLTSTVDMVPVNALHSHAAVSGIAPAVPHVSPMALTVQHPATAASLTTPHTDHAHAVSGPSTPTGASSSLPLHTFNTDATQPAQTLTSLTSVPASAEQTSEAAYMHANGNVTHTTQSSTPAHTNTTPTSTGGRSTNTSTELNGNDGSHMHIDRDVPQPSGTQMAEVAAGDNSSLIATVVHQSTDDTHMTEAAPVNIIEAHVRDSVQADTHLADALPIGNIPAAAAVSAVQQEACVVFSGPATP